MREITLEVKAARARLEEVVAVCVAETLDALPARLLRLDAGRLVALMDELAEVREREMEGMLVSLARAGDDLWKEGGRGE